MERNEMPERWWEPGSEDANEHPLDKPWIDEDPPFEN